jgi:GR25 family glycosyltransferase involved in LPS biosynthesis
MIFPFDKIFFINLDTGIGRKNVMLKQFEQMDIRDKNGNKPERFAANKGIKVPQKIDATGRKRMISKSEIGCYASHYSLYKLIAESNFETVLILEDDCLFDQGKMESIIENWHLVPDFELLYFYCHNCMKVPLIKKVVSIELNLNEAHGLWLTHCYAVSKSAAIRLVKDLETQKGGLDWHLSQLQKDYKTLVFDNQPAIQNKRFSTQIIHTQ